MRDKGRVTTEERGEEKRALGGLEESRPSNGIQNKPAALARKSSSSKQGEGMDGPASTSASVAFFFQGCSER